MKILISGLIAVGIAAGVWLAWWAGLIIVLLGIYHLISDRFPSKTKKYMPFIINGAVVLLVGIFLTKQWLPLGPAKGMIRNFVFVAILVGGLQLLFYFFQIWYAPVLRWFLDHKIVFMSVPVILVVLGILIWFGLGREFMPELHEGSFLYMPTTGAHASIAEALDVMQKQDIAIRSIPEVESVVGKLGRVESALDPAPINMFETVVTYKPEYKTDKDGWRIRFQFDKKKNEFVRDDKR